MSESSGALYFVLVVRLHFLALSRRTRSRFVGRVGHSSRCCVSSRSSHSSGRHSHFTLCSFVRRRVPRSSHAGPSPQASSVEHLHSLRPFAVYARPAASACVRSRPVAASRAPFQPPFSSAVFLSDTRSRHLCPRLRRLRCLFVFPRPSLIGPNWLPTTSALGL